MQYFARECVTCHRAKIQRRCRLEPNHILAPDNRFEHVYMDLIELPPVRGFRYCLTIIDCFSRWPTAIPLQDMEADTVATAFYNNWVCCFGTPLTITTNQGA